MAQKRDATFDPDSDLSEIFTRLWEVDTNKCFPGEDYEIDLQGCTYYRSGDRAPDKLFTWFDEEKVFGRKTYQAFRKLLDNYEMVLGLPEVVTWEEKIEVRDFLDAIMETQVMQEAHKYLVSKGVASADVMTFKKLLNDIWFRLIHRTKNNRQFDSSSFEHVFVGERRNESVIGLHNWLQYYLLEKTGDIDYQGFCRKHTEFADETLRLICVNFSWRGLKGKPMCSILLGTSPEFEIAIFTISYLLNKEGYTDVKLGEYEIELVFYPIGRSIGTSYVVAARME